MGIDEQINAMRGPKPSEGCTFLKMSGKWCGEPTTCADKGQPRCDRHSPQLSVRMAAIRAKHVQP